MYYIAKNEAKNDEIKAQGIPPGNSLKFSFHEYTAKHDIKEDAEKVLNYYMAVYKETFGKEHMKLRAVTWQDIADDLFTVYDEYFDRTFEIDVEGLEKMINHYFSKQYQNGCNYCAPHFNNQRIKKINFFEAVEF